RRFPPTGGRSWVRVHVPTGSSEPVANVTGFRRYGLRRLSRPWPEIPPPAPGHSTAQGSRLPEARAEGFADRRSGGHRKKYSTSLMYEYHQSARPGWTRYAAPAWAARSYLMSKAPTRSDDSSAGRVWGERGAASIGRRWAPRWVWGRR